MRHVAYAIATWRGCPNAAAGRPVMLPDGKHFHSAEVAAKKSKISLMQKIVLARKFEAYKIILCALVKYKNYMICRKLRTAHSYSVAG